VKEIHLPPEEEVLRSLTAGEEVLLSGQVLTMRDAALARLEGMVREGGKPPFDLAGQVVFYAGPTPPAAGRPAGAIGPTTSARMDHLLKLLIDAGAVATLGKGPRSADAVTLHERHGLVYLAAVGGLAALYGGMVEAMEPVAWEDLGPEAVYRVTLNNFPATVAIDSSGRDHYSSQHASYRRD
jgi:tartrate/fumarate subfamily iron-sulfur-dependent hydro-lyase beta chain